MEPKRKDLVDYFMLLVLTVSWLRFFSYFLVVREISKLLLTLIEMIGDTLSFLFIVSCFILIMSSIFATLYQDNFPEKYGGLAKTVTTLFNGVVAQYWYDDEEMKGRVISHSMLTIFHVFFTNIILMNYLIAILSSTYSKMKQSGIFSFKVNLYQYCERFLTAFKDRDYGELLMHPPPLSFICGILVLFVWSRPAMSKLSKWISYMMFWVENVVYVLCFFLFEVIISPFAYLKIWFNLFQIVKTTGSGTLGFFKSLFYTLIWAFLGPLLMIYIVSVDIKNFLHILIFHDGFTRTKEDRIAAFKTDDNMKIRLYNETRAIVISLSKKIGKFIQKENELALNLTDELVIEDSCDDDVLERIPDFYIFDDQQSYSLSGSTNEEQTYFVQKKSMILEEWKKRKAQYEKKLLAKQMDYSSSNDASNNLIKDKLMKVFSHSVKNRLDELKKE